MTFRMPVYDTIAFAFDSTADEIDEGLSPHPKIQASP